MEVNVMLTPIVADPFGSGVDDRIDGKGGNDLIGRARIAQESRRWRDGDSIYAANDVLTRRVA